MRRVIRRSGRAWIGAALVCAFWGGPNLSRAQEPEVLCHNGSGSFGAVVNGQVTVQVKTARNGMLAIRACSATLSGNKQVLSVADGVAQIDVDTFGGDLGLGMPVVAFQVKKSDSDCCMEYQVFSLAAPVRLMRTISGGESFIAQDVDLDGRVEIWTNDLRAMRGFENLTALDMDPPTIVLRFEGGKLLDVSSEFRSYFDGKIEGLRKELDAESLRDFKNSDGKLSIDTSLAPAQIHRLREIKGKVLGIILGYLYSGREKEAWNALAEMWPAADADRIRSAIVSARAQGMMAQVDGTSSEPADRQKKQVAIYNAMDLSGGRPEVTPPRAILLWQPAPLVSLDHGSSPAETQVELVVDSAGKVRSAEQTTKKGPADDALLHAALGWKFIPAFKNGHAVASRTRLAVSPRQ